MEEDEQDEIDEDNLSKCEDHISDEEESIENDEFIRNEKSITQTYQLDSSRCFRNNKFL